MYFKKSSSVTNLSNKTKKFHSKIKLFIHRVFKQNANLIFKSFVFVFCCSFLFYMVIYICNDYYSYKTVVQIKTSKPKEILLPSISVCKKIDSNYIFQKLKKTGKIKRLNVDKIDKLEDLNKVFDEFLSKYKIADLGMILYNYFANCTDAKSDGDCRDGIPIHSFTNRRVCITYFSKLYINYFTNTESDSKIDISNNGTKNSIISESMIAWFKIDNPDDNVHVLIHSSSQMPDVNLYDMEMTRTRILKNKTYGILFEKKSISRLPDPYETHCSNYFDLRATSDDALSEVGCVDGCKKRYFKANLKCIPIDMGVVTESTDLDETNLCTCRSKKCDEINCNDQIPCFEEGSTEEIDYQNHVSGCESNCKQDCYEDYYSTQQFELEKDVEIGLFKQYTINASELTPNSTIVFIAAKYSEEMSYQHTPKMNLFEFFANLGGLFSLWLGASVLYCYDFVKQILIYLKNKDVKKFNRRLFQNVLNKNRIQILGSNQFNRRNVKRFNFNNDIRNYI